MKHRALTIAFFALMLLMGAAWGVSAPPSGWDKVEPGLLAKVSPGAEIEFLVLLREQAVPTAARAGCSKAEKGAQVYRELSAVAERTQAPLLKTIQARQVEFRSFWIVNLIWVKGDASLLLELAERPEVDRIFDNPRLPQDLPQPEGRQLSAHQPTAPSWNLIKIGAPDVWNIGVRGEGVVIGGVDTGYAWQHPALLSSYRGWNGTSADHDYNWHDAVHGSGGGNCGQDAVAPCDDYGHGTHTMGIMVGDDGAGNQVGVAPAARWIGCRCMNQGFGTPAMYIECLQWMLAPTDLDGLYADPAKAPDVINNSWTCPPSEGCIDPAVLEAAVDALRAAGIVVVVSAGNYGSSCASVREPPSIYEASFSVGSTTSADAASSFSSRGPVTSDGSNRLKPDLAAPGSDIRSAYPGNTYQFMSGTSMAAPHVAGAVALLISADPALAGNPELLESRLESTALSLLTSQDCGGVSGQAVPNNTFGYGRLDVLAAVQETLKVPGDLNGDRRCTSADQEILQGFLAENLRHGQNGFSAGLDQADLDGNGRVEATDLLLLRRKLEAP